MSTENNESEGHIATNAYTYAKFNVQSGSDGLYEEIEVGGMGEEGLQIALEEFFSSCQEAGNRIDAATSKIGLSLATYPNTLYPNDNEGFGMEDFKPSDSVTSVNMGGGGAADLVRVLEKIAYFWKEHEKDFRQFWFEMAIESRRNFLRIVCPQMPESVSDPTFTLNGVTTRVDGAVVLLPFLTIDTLKTGRTLPDYMHRGTQESLLEYTRNSIFSLRQITASSNQVNYDAQKRMNHDSGTRTHYHVFSENPPYHHEAKVPPAAVRGGKKAVVAWEKANMKALIEAEMACTDYEFDHVRVMTATEITLSANIVDEYRSRVLKKTDFPKTMTPLMRCLQCGSSAKKLLICSRCKVARYCSSLCQKAHWKTHKRDCPKHT